MAIVPGSVSRRRDTDSSPLDQQEATSPAASSVGSPESAGRGRHLRRRTVAEREAVELEAVTRDRRGRLVGVQLQLAAAAECGVLQGRELAPGCGRGQALLGRADHCAGVPFAHPEADRLARRVAANRALDRVGRAGRYRVDRPWRGVHRQAARPRGGHPPRLRTGVAAADKRERAEARLPARHRVTAALGGPAGERSLEVAVLEQRVRPPGSASPGLASALPAASTARTSSSCRPLATWNVGVRAAGGERAAVQPALEGRRPAPRRRSEVGRAGAVRARRAGRDRGVGRAWCPPPGWSTCGVAGRGVHVAGGVDRADPEGVAARRRDRSSPSASCRPCRRWSSRASTGRWSRSRSM